VHKEEMAMASALPVDIIAMKSMTYWKCKKEGEFHSFMTRKILIRLTKIAKAPTLPSISMAVAGGTRPSAYILTEI
jgi:hypothetical protein